MNNEKKKYGYSFPNAIAMYWFYFLPMIISFLIFLIAFRNEVFIENANEEILINLSCLFILSIIVMPILAYIFANSFPAIRINSDGLGIQIYSPIRTRWVFIKWNEIDYIEEYTFPTRIFFRHNKKWVFVKSKRLPFAYLILSALYKQSFNRGFIISPKINNYNEVIDLITDNYWKNRK